MTIEDGVVATEKSADELVGRLFEATLGMMDILSVYLGDRLGLYRALRDGGPATAGELATRTGIDPRYALEWLEQQAVTGLLEVDDVAAAADERRYRLPEAYADPLLDPDSPYSIAPLARSSAAYARVMPELLGAFRGGGGVAWSDYGADMIEAQGDFNRPWLVGSFATEMLPAIAGVAERLVADPPARVADVACGVGWAAVAIARAYPSVYVDGFDIDASSVELANRNARDAGVSDRVTFRVRDVADAEPGAYDLAVIIEAVHDMTEPAGVLASVRRMLRPDGILLVADEKSEDAFTAPGSDVERFFYGFSILTCLPAAMTERPTAAIGTVIRADTMSRLGAEAGFRSIERLDEPSSETLRFYRMTT
jgi:2-polyprenyl-3-methyl-5-hydroxy-6-metoxy-1,4-benzoquinol methylase